MTRQTQPVLVELLPSRREGTVVDPVSHLLHPIRWERARSGRRLRQTFPDGGKVQVYNSRVITWYGVIAATGWHPDDPALPILLVLGIGALVIGGLWGIALTTLFRRSR